MKRNLTHATVMALKPPATGQTDVWDARKAGFGIRVSNGGTKTWQLLYRADGRKHRLTLGRFPTLSVADARSKATSVLGDVAKGENPAEERAEQKLEPTFGEFAVVYLERHAMVHKRARSILEDRRFLKGPDLAPWRHRKLAEIRKRDVVALLDKMVARDAPIQANRMHSLLGKMFAFALARDVVELNPTTGIPREPEHTRDRKLTDEELSRLWLALDIQPQKIAAAFKLLLLTGMRKGEVLGLRWDEIDIEHAVITLPAIRTKNGLAHTLPLTSTAIALLEALPRVGVFVFPGSRGGMAVHNIDKYIDRIRNAAQLENFRLHDTRRTVATRLAELGSDRTTLKKILNHSDRGDITSVYDRHDYVHEMRAALMRWERRLTEIVTGTPAASKVVELRA